MLSFGFYPKITLPTRICNTSSTIIDNNYANKLIVMTIQQFLSIRYQIIKPFLLPHLPNLVLKCKINMSPFKIYDDNFVTELRNINITDSLNNNVNPNPSKNYDIFIKLLQDAKDKHLPVRKIKFNKYKHKKNKWITRGILKSIKH